MNQRSTTAATLTKAGGSVRAPQGVSQDLEADMAEGLGVPEDLESLERMLLVHQGDLGCLAGW